MTRRLAGFFRVFNTFAVSTIIAILSFSLSPAIVYQFTILVHLSSLKPELLMGVLDSYMVFQLALLHK